MADEISSLKVVVEVEDKATEKLNSFKDTMKEIEKEEESLSKSQDNTAQSTDKLSKSAETAASTSKKQSKSLNQETKAQKEVNEQIQSTSRSRTQDTAQTKASTDAQDKYTESLKKNTQASEQNRKENEKAKKSLQDTGSNLKGLGEGLDGATKPLQAAAVGVLAGGIAATKAAMDYETAFTGVKKTVDGTPEELKRVSDELKELSTDIPVYADELANLAAVGGQLGVQTPHIVKFTKTMSAMGVATNLAGEDGAAAIAKLINVTGEEMDNVDRVGSSIVALGNNTATTEADIAAMSVRMGKFGNTVGMNTAQVLAYSAALSSAGVEAQAGGSAMGRVWLDIEKAVANGGESLNAYAKYAGTSAAEFKKQWSTDPSGAFNGLIKGLSVAENLTTALAEMGIENTLDQQSVMALANNFEMLEKCLNLSSKAYEENTALSKEAEAAYATTANELKTTISAVQNAAASFGELILPDIRAVAEDVGTYAKNLNNMSDNQKRAILTAGKLTVATGLVAKGAVTAIKTTGDVIEGAGKIKKTFSALKIAPTLASVVSTAGPAALAIGGVTAAVVIGKKAYDAYRDAQIHWGKSLVEPTQRLEESISKFKELNSIQNELTGLKVVIQSDKSNQAEVETAKTRIKEIATLLSEQYDLNIDVDNSGIDETINKLDEAIAKQEKINLNETRTNASSLNVELAEKKTDYIDNKKIIEENTEKINTQSAAVENLENSYAKIYNRWNEFERVRDTWEKNTGQMMDSSNELFKDFFADIRAIAEQDDIEELINAEDFLSLMPYLTNTQDKIKAAREELQKLKEDNQGYIDSQKQFEESRQKYTDYGFAELEFGDTAKGFEIITSAVKEYGESAETVTQRVNELAQSTDILPEGVKINISAEGDISLIDIASNRVKEIQSSNNLNVKINADGNLEILDKATGKMETIKNSGAVALRLEADGSISMLDALENKIGTIDGSTAEVVFKKDSKEVDEYDPPNLERTVTYKIKTKGLIPNAKGTQNFKGGLAMVNDQKGISDPRELIIDRGRAFIPQGKDVILPLSKGAKVYTASQTKAIMSNLGIPRYAEGKNNSDAFISARDSWSHYTGTHAVTVSQELAKWVDLSKTYKSNAKDIEDIQEQIYQKTRALREEQNEISQEYIEERSFFNDWDSFADSAVDAYNRVADREKQYVLKGKITQKEADDYLKKLGEDMYNSRVENSREWLEKQVEYSNMSVEEQLEGIKRIENYTKEYYQQGIISYRKYIEAQNDIDKMRIETVRNNYSKQQNSAERYIKMSETFDSWNPGDNKVQAYERLLSKLNEAYKSGAYADNEEEYWDKRADLLIKIQNAKSEIFDEMLSAQSDYIDRINEQYDKAIEAKQKTYDDRVLARDISEASARVDMYSGAVTQAGKDAYKQASEELESLKNEQEIKLLQEKQQQTVSQLQEDYNRVEKYKNEILQGMNTNGYDIKLITETIKNNTSGMQNIFSSLVSAIGRLSASPASNTYGDTNYNITASDSTLVSYLMSRGASALSGG